MHSPLPPYSVCVCVCMSVVWSLLCCVCPPSLGTSLCCSAQTGPPPSGVSLELWTRRCRVLMSGPRCSSQAPTPCPSSWAHGSASLWQLGRYAGSPSRTRPLAASSLMSRRSRRFPSQQSGSTSTQSRRNPCRHPSQSAGTTTSPELAPTSSLENGNA